MIQNHEKLLDQLTRELSALRNKLVFSCETKSPGTVWSCASAGHCAVTAYAMIYYFGCGSYASAIVNGESHWFFRLKVNECSFDIDLTGDQFGYDPIQIAEAGKLYPGTRTRSLSEMNPETLSRADKFIRNSNLKSRFDEFINNKICLECHINDSGGYFVCDQCFTNRQGSS